MSTPRRTILVPIVGGDLTPTEFADACAAIDRGDTRLVLLHIADDTRRVPRPTGIARWRRLADRVAPRDVYVETVCGDTRHVIADEMARFGAELVTTHDEAMYPEEVAC